MVVPLLSAILLRPSVNADKSFIAISGRKLNSVICSESKMQELGLSVPKRLRDFFKSYASSWRAKISWNKQLPASASGAELGP